MGHALDDALDVAAAGVVALVVAVVVAVVVDGAGIVGVPALVFVVVVAVVVVAVIVVGAGIVGVVALVFAVVVAVVVIGAGIIVEAIAVLVGGAFSIGCACTIIFVGKPKVIATANALAATHAPASAPVFLACVVGLLGLNNNTHANIVASMISTTIGGGPLLPKHPQLASPEITTLTRMATNSVSTNAAIARLNRGSKIMAAANVNSMEIVPRSAMSKKRVKSASAPMPTRLAIHVYAPRTGLGSNAGVPSSNFTSAPVNNHAGTIARHMMVPKSDPVRTAEALLEELCESPVA